MIKRRNSSRRVAIIAGGTSKFGRRQATYRDLIAEAGKKVKISCPRLLPSMIEGLLVASVMPERFVFQTHVAPLAAEVLGIKPSRMMARVELLCGSGSTAIRLGYATIASGLADVVAVVGVEKMNLPDQLESSYHMLAACDREWDSVHGLTAPPFFAMVAQRHMLEYGTTARQLAEVSRKNHYNSSLNPDAQFTKKFSLAEIMSSKPVAPPLRLYDCSAITDGAAMIVLAEAKLARELVDKPICILGLGQAGSGNNSTNVPGFTTWPTLKQAVETAYQMAGIGPEDIDVAEIHDCFSISEIIITEDLGFTSKGNGGPYIESGATCIDGNVAVNPGGGLLGRGHPLGATGVAQAVEIMMQLRGETGSRQVTNAKIGLTHNLSGLTTENTVTIYGRE